MRVSMRESQRVFDLLAGEWRSIRVSNGRMEFDLIGNETLSDMKAFLDRCFPDTKHLLTEVKP